MFIVGFIVGFIFGFFIIALLSVDRREEPVDLTQYGNHVFHDCTVTVFRNTVTGETSVTWFKEEV